MLAANEINADVQQLCFCNSSLAWVRTKKHAGPRCREGSTFNKVDWHICQAVHHSPETVKILLNTCRQ